ncbi:MAG TPA: UDP-glucose 4-epimerase GalE, partial [Ruminococcus sp.]|nr:UDP-glucose 4-epimerase GalE [Ruminococcus sp.]
NPYGWTKVMMEQILEDAAKADQGLSVVLLRYFNPIGAHESGKIGEDPQGIPNNLMPYVAQVAVGRREKLTIFGRDYDTPDGTCRRDYIHVVDLAKGHVKAIEYSANHKGTEVFNLGTGTGYSVLDIVKAFIKVNKIDIPYVIKPRRAGDIAECYADASKAEKILGWKAEKSLEDMCYDSWNWQSHNVNGYK